MTEYQAYLLRRAAELMEDAAYASPAWEQEAREIARELREMADR